MSSYQEVMEAAWRDLKASDIVVLGLRAGELESCLPESLRAGDLIDGYENTPFLDAFLNTRTERVRLVHGQETLEYRRSEEESMSVMDTAETPAELRSRISYFKV